MKDMAVCYSSRIDWWLVVFITLLPAFLSGYDAYEKSHSVFTGLINGFLFFAVVSIALAAFTFPSKCIIKENELFVQYGLFLTKTIPYEDITNVVPSFSLWAAPCLSFHRVRIDLSGKIFPFMPFHQFVYVAPIDRDEFISVLRQKIEQAS